MIAIIDLFRPKIILDFQKLYEKMGIDLNSRYAHAAPTSSAKPPSVQI